MDIMILPVVTEKANRVAQDGNRATFKVTPTATKSKIKSVVEELYGVKVVSVNTMNCRGKRKSRYTKGGLIKGRTNAYKKAIVTLAEGDTIDFYSNIQ